ncbi:MAG: hypothetical protein IJH07_02030 [Ruminococcus sp.]|nr:hypothetical protein [Ruminococcus sp.]
MDDKFQKTLKELIPYIIISGILFLLLPLFMGKDTGFATYFIELGLFPLTALVCGAVYKVRNKKNSLYLCLIAPLFFALTALLYGMWSSSWYTVLIYIAAYFLCGYLGLILGDVLPINKKGVSVRDMIKKPARSPHRVNVEEDLSDEPFEAKDPAQDDELDISTTEDDIAAILNDIHNRKSQ